jgi:ankyrin repeat protein
MKEPYKEDIEFVEAIMSDSEMVNALNRACHNGNLDIVRTLVESGANVNSRDKNGWHSLAWAADYQKVEVVRYLIDSGADVNMADNEGVTPIMWSVGLYFKREGKDCRDIMDLLVSYGADINAYSTRHKSNALGLALRMRNYWAMNALIELGADIYMNESENSSIIDRVPDETERAKLYDTYNNSSHHLLK